MFDVGDSKVRAFCGLLYDQQAARLKRDYPNLPNMDRARIVATPGRRWIKVDVGGSGKFLIDQRSERGDIYGIKGYGKPHKGHRYGNLDTTSEYQWGDYAPVVVKP